MNAEIIRRSILRRELGGGVGIALLIGLGACAGDFLWALGVASGAGAIADAPKVRAILSVISLVLLLTLAFLFGRGAWKTACEHRSRPTSVDANPGRGRSADRHGRRAALLGFTLAVTSPWNLGFWLAVIGSQQVGDPQHTFGGSVALALSVVLGAATWVAVLCLVLSKGGKLFVHPRWQVITQAITCVVMLFFAARVVAQLF